MINIINKISCCGCTACASICAHDAITMQPDALGFLYPVVEKSKCVECGLCEKVCQFNDNYDRSLNLLEPIAYAVRHKDINEVMKSRSGAAFVAISNYILEQGGVVYGAGYKDHFRVAHKRATTKEARDEFRGSKYVQSDLTGIFRMVKEDLMKGLIVLFSGTPCQTSGLNAYISKRLRENLVLIDVVCHGVPGPYLWRDYLSCLEEKEKDTIQGVDFRDKREFGWRAHVETFKYVHTSERKRYKHRFYQEIAFRPSCHNCPFSNTKRPADITIGDCWGWENVCPEMNKDDKGVNLLLLNTEKGSQLFDQIVDVLLCKPLIKNTYLQPNLISPTSKHPKQDQFEKDYVKYGISYVVEHCYTPQSTKHRIKNIILTSKTILKRIL